MVSMHSLLFSVNNSPNSTWNIELCNSFQGFCQFLFQAILNRDYKIPNCWGKLFKRGLQFIKLSFMCLGRFHVVCPDTEVFCVSNFVNCHFILCSISSESLALTSENLPYLLPTTWRFPGLHAHLIPCTLLRAGLVQSSIKVFKAEFASPEITLVIICIFNLTCWNFTTFMSVHSSKSCQDCWLMF